MKITGVRTKLYEHDLLRPLGDANSPRGRTRFTNLAVFIDTDEEITGVSMSGAGVASHIHTLVESLLIGRDPRGVKGLWKKMMDFVFKGGAVGGVGAALSAIDIALWDLKAKANNEPLWRTLGASTRRVKAYASGIDMPLSNEQLGIFYENMAAKGVSAGKLKVGLDRDVDMERIGIMRDALSKSGKRPAILIDANEYWSPKQAIRHVSFFEEEFDITWVEEPARRWDYKGLRRVSQAVRAAVATGENLDQIGEYLALIDNEAVDIVQIGGGPYGITGAIQIADLAYGFELPVSVMNCAGNYMAHLAAALPNHMMMEVLEAGRDAAFNIDNHIEDGWIVLGDSPGLGLSFNEQLIDHYAIDKPTGTGSTNPFGRRLGAGLFEVPPGDSEDLDE